MATPELRWATAADTNAILDLLDEYHAQEGLTQHSRNKNRNLLEEVFETRKGRILVAQEADEILGYALVIRRVSFEWASEVAVLDEIFIKGKARERGLGRRESRGAGGGVQPADHDDSRVAGVGPSSWRKGSWRRAASMYSSSQSRSLSR